MGTRYRLTPVQAGNISVVNLRPVAIQTHPRLRGEYIRQLIHIKGAVDSPPLARGISLRSPQELHISGLTLAHAGNIIRDLRDM